jgi:hypothetical protein
MNRPATLLIASLTLVGCSGSGAERQGSSAVHGKPPASGTAIVTGTTLDAATGQPVGGVEVSGPGGVTATPDDAGRFVLKDLPEGVAGELRARSRDGKQAVNQLRVIG